jgi:hypothetical protein
MSISRLRRRAGRVHCSSIVSAQIRNVEAVFSTEPSERPHQPPKTEAGYRSSHLHNIILLFCLAVDGVSCSLHPVGGGAERGTFASVSSFESTRLFSRETDRRLACPVCNGPARLVFCGIRPVSEFGTAFTRRRVIAIDFQPTEFAVHATKSSSAFTGEPARPRTRTQACAAESSALGAVAGIAN